MESMTFSLIDVAIIIFLIAIGVFVVKIGISFDINAWMKHKSKNNEHKLRMLCTHTQITLKNDNIEVKSLFISPPGTIEWICTRCNTRIYDSDLPNQLIEFYVSNIDTYMKKEKKFKKHIRRHYGV